MRFSTDPNHAQHKDALLDAETLELRLPDGTEQDRHTYHPDDFGRPEGWYWRPCLQDGRPVGPFKTEALAVVDARRRRS